MRWSLLVFLMCATPAFAETILVLPIQGKGDHHATEAQLERALTDRGVTVIGARAAHRLGDPARCKEKTPCLATIGKKAKAQKVLAGRAAPDGKSVAFTLIASENGAVIQTASLAFPAGSDPIKIVNDGIGRVVPTDEEPALQAVAPISKKKAVMPVTETIDAAPSDSGLLLAAPVKVERGPPPRSRGLLYSGIAIAAVGVIGLGTGAAFFVLSQNTAAKGQSPDTRQPELPGLQSSLNSQITGANIGFIAGGILLAVGAILIGSDLVLQKRAQPRLSVTPNGASASVEVLW